MRRIIWVVLFAPALLCAHQHLCEKQVTEDAVERITKEKHLCQNTTMPGMISHDEEALLVKKARKIACDAALAQSAKICPARPCDECDRECKMRFAPEGAKCSLVKCDSQRLPASIDDCHYAGLSKEVYSTKTCIAVQATATIRCLQKTLFNVELPALTPADSETPVSP